MAGFKLEGDKFVLPVVFDNFIKGFKIIEDRGLQAFNKLNKSISNLTKMQQKMIKGFDITKPISSMQTMLGNLRDRFSEVFTKSLSAGRGIIKSLNSALISVLKNSKGILIIFSQLSAPLLALAGIAFTLWEVWRFNIGKVQTYFFQVIGQLKVAWAKFELAFRNLLTKYSPMIEKFVQLFAWGLSGGIKIVEGLLYGLLEILDPIMEAINEVVDVFSELFNEMSDGEKTIDIFEVLKNTLIGIGRVIGWIIRIAAAIIIPFVKMSAWISKIERKFAEWVLRLKPVQDMLKFIGWIIDETIVKPFNNLMGVIDKIGDVLGFNNEKQSKTNSVPVQTQTPISYTTNANNSRTVNNQNVVSIHTSSPIDTARAPRIGELIGKEINNYSLT